MVESRLNWVRTIVGRKTVRRLVIVIQVRAGGDLIQDLEVISAREIYEVESTRSGEQLDMGEEGKKNHN